MVAGWRKVTICIWDDLELDDLSRDEVFDAVPAPLTGAYIMFDVNTRWDATLKNGLRRLRQEKNNAIRTKPATAAT